jgi:hypothetical protein
MPIHVPGTATVVSRTCEASTSGYRGKVDTPKTQKSIPVVALSASVREDLETWLTRSPNDPASWLFPSEKLDTPLSRDNALYRYIRPRLEKVKLGWVDFQVMRRTHSSLMRELGVDPKVVANLPVQRQLQFSNLPAHLRNLLLQSLLRQSERSRHPARSGPSSREPGIGSRAACRSVTWSAGKFIGRWALDTGRWALDTGRWALDTGRWALDIRNPTALQGLRPDILQPSM